MNNFFKMLFGQDNKDDQEIGDFKHDQEIGDFDEKNVSWQPTPARPGDIVRINYHGMLKNSGTNEVFLHYGFDNWNSGITTIKMEQMEDGGFGADIKASENREINFCFKDAANNWDNNHGSNWHLGLQ